MTANYSMTFIRDINCKPQNDSSKLRHYSDTVAIKAKYNENVSKTIQLFDDAFIDPFKISNALLAMSILLQVSQHRHKLSKVRKRAKIRNRYNQAPPLIQDTNGKVTTSQFDITTRAKRPALSQQVTTRQQQTDVHESITKQDRNNINDPQKKHRLGKVRKIFYWRA